MESIVAKKFDPPRLHHSKPLEFKGFSDKNRTRIKQRCPAGWDKFGTFRKWTRAFHHRGIPQLARRRTNISTIKRPGGRKTHRVRIRRKGVPEFSAYVDGEAKAKAIAVRDRQAGRIQDIKHTGADPKVTVREAINHYRKSDRYRALTAPRQSKGI